jgi:signal transduction histidine kinase
LNAQTEFHTRLQGKWLLAARLAWAAMFTVLNTMYALGFLAVRDTLSTVCEEEPCTLYVQIRHTDAGAQITQWGGPPIGFADPLRADQVKALAKLGLTLNEYGWLGALQMGIPALVYLLIAAGLFWRKSADWMVLFISTVVMMSPLVDMPLPYTLAMRQPIWQWVHTAAHFLAVSSWFTWPLVFPTGRFVPRWTRWKIFFDIAFAVSGTLLASSILREPAGWGNFLYIYVVLSTCINVFALSYRYFRVASPVEHQQIKWVFIGLLGFITIAFVSLQFDFRLISQAGSMDPVRALGLSVIPDTLYRTVALFIPVSIALSVLRYRLWDIDVIINRAMVYSTLTAVIAGLYILVVGSLSSLMQNQNDLAATAVALLIVAALVQPVRRSLQNIVNRLLRFDPGRRDESQVALQKPSEPPEEIQEKQIQLPAMTEVNSSAHTRLRGKWLLSARLVWIAIAMLTTILHIVALPVAFNLLRTPCYQEPCATPFQTPSGTESVGQEEASLQGAWQSSVWEITAWLVPLAVALLIFWRRSDDWVAHLASIMLVTVIMISPWPEMLAAAQPFWYWPRAVLWAVGLASSVGLFYLFPDGRFVPRWTGGLAFVLLVIIGALAAEGAPFLAGFPIFMIVLITGMVFQIYRYRHVSDPLQRQQTKWVVLGIIGMVLPMLIVFFVAFLNPSWNPLLPGAARSLHVTEVFGNMVTAGLIIPLCFLPVTLAFSMLHYRLWDVDILINRTLVYGVLTASVVALYVFIVGWSSIGLQTQNNLAGSVFAILVIAFLFRPLRQRLQRIANRFVPVPHTALPAEGPKHQIALPAGQSAADTRLRGRWLFIARLAWAAVFLTLTAMYAFGFVVMHDVLSRVCEAEPCTLGHQIRHTEAGEQILDYIGPPLGYADPLGPDQVEALQRLGLTLDQYGWLGALQMGLPLLVYLLIAAGLFWRKSDEWMVLFVSIMVATFSLQLLPLPLTLVVRQPAWEWVYFPATAVAISFFFIFPLIFPTGQFVPRWTRWIAVFEAAGAVLLSWFQYSILKVPAGELVLVYVYIAFGAGVYAQLYRYFRVATAIERQQLKWVIVGLGAFIITADLLLVPLNGLLASRAASMDTARALVLSTVLDILFLLICLFLPVSIVISVLRYRLWDIDILINRTLVYGTLTGIVVTAFVILVGFLSVLFQSSGNSIIAIIATGLVALLFNPLRQRLQRRVNHLMYGERDEPYTALSRLGRQLASTLAPEAVLPTVVNTVRDVLRLPYVAIYLQQDSQGYKIVAESASHQLRTENGRIRVPGIEREGRCIPLIHQGETVGYIVLGPRAPNEAFSTTDLRLLQDLAPQVGVAVHAVRLTADLQRSRERLVLAREEERRRLRRDLHDGLGPQLAGLALKLETLRNRLNSDPLADSILADLAKQTQNATADIRHLVYELRPPTLDEFGLVMALQEGVSQFTQQGVNGLNIAFDAPESLPPLPAAVEVAAYRIVQEALTNVIRHAGARSCHIDLRLDESGCLLCLEVKDDGKGLALKRPAGVGLNSMRERAEELGGTFMIAPILTGGTLLTAKLPCRLDLKPAARDVFVSSDEEG